jgi:hypothetical protein
MWIKSEKPVEKQDKLPARPRKRNTSLLPPGKEMLKIRMIFIGKMILPFIDSDLLYRGTILGRLECNF